MTDVLWDKIRDAYSSQSIDDLWAQEPEIDKVIRLLQKKPIITIVGTPHSGRASVLRLIQERLGSCVNRSLLEYTDAIDVEDFWKRLANDLISQLAERAVQPTSYKFPRDAWRFFQDLTESEALYLLFDDFHELQGQTWEQPVLDTCQSLSNIPKLHLVLVGDIYPCGTDMSEDFPFGHLTTPIHLGRLISRITLEQYVRRAEPHDVEYTRRAIEAIIELAGREPVLVQRLCAEIAALLECQESRRVGEDEVGAAKLKLINKAGNDIFLNQWFSLTFMEQLVLIVVRALEQEFGEGVSPEEVRLRLHDYSCLVEASETGVDIDPRGSLKLLSRRSILNRENWRYTFANALFSDWLPQVPDPDRILSRTLCKGFAALARSASYSSKLEGWLVEAGFPPEKHNKEKLIGDLFLLVRGKPKRASPVILHISDTQFGENHAFKFTEPSNTQSLFYELKRALDKCLKDHELSRPNIIVISGDIANWATPSEYESAAQFIEALCSHLGIDRHHVVLVPGNHDVNFKLSRMAFLKVSNEKTYELREGSPDEEIYPLRFVHFKRFFETFYGGRRQYSLDPEHMYSIYEFQHLGLLIVGLNSCDEIDHTGREGKIREQAIENARKEIERIEERLRVPYELVVAVWHHNPHPVAGAADLLTNGDKVAEILGPKCQIALYGHIHQPHYMPKLAGGLQECDVRCIGAGAVGVEEKHRGGDDRKARWPLSFNVIELDLHSLSNSRLYSFNAFPGTKWQALQWDGKKLWRDFQTA